MTAALWDFPWGGGFSYQATLTMAARIFIM